MHAHTPHQLNGARYGFPPSVVEELTVFVADPRFEVARAIDATRLEDDVWAYEGTNVH